MAAAAAAAAAPAQPNPPVLLDDHLRSVAVSGDGAGGSSLPSSSSAPPHSASSARAILQAWSDLRNTSSTNPSPSLQLLSSSIPSLLISDPQAKLLLSLLSRSSSSLESSPQPSVRSYLYILLHAWLRKSNRPNPSLLSNLLSNLSNSSSYCPLPYNILLLGALSAAPTISPADRDSCFDHIKQILQQRSDFHNNFVPEALAGIGYALSVADNTSFKTILGLLLEKKELGRNVGDGVRNSLMVLRLVDWAVCKVIASKAFDKVELLCNEISPGMCKVKDYAPFLVIMVAAGALRAFRLMAGSNGRVEIGQGIQNSLEESITYIAQNLVLGVENGGELESFSIENRIVLQCIPLGLARCGAILGSGHVLRCLCLALLSEVFPLRFFFRMVVDGKSKEAASSAHYMVKEHLDGLLFKEAGAVTGVMCNQYTSANDSSKAFVEMNMWKYCKELYSYLRRASLALRGRNDDLLKHLEKIADSAFLMVVVFSAEVARHKLTPQASQNIKEDAALRILVAFSCIEYLRKIRLPQYTDAIQKAVLVLQESATCTILFVESMPQYVEVIDQNVEYTWYEDEVQTARILFYLRVIPTCAGLTPAAVFEKTVVPTMFLYMQHPNGKVARASHSVFVAFVSSGNASEEERQTTLKEQLVFFYIQRALEAYPGITPFEGLASGVAALVRHVPAGSPAIFYSVHNIVDKAKELCEVMNDNRDIWKNWEGSTEPSKKIVDLLLRLFFLVDIQVLPYLLKQSAEFILQLPKDGQNVLLDDISSQIAESDDVTRKPVFVSWLQSLSFICSQNSIDSLSINGTMSRL